MKHILDAIEQERAKWAGTPIAVPTIWPNTRDAFFEALDRIAKAVKKAEMPGDGGEFERVAEGCKWAPENASIGKDITMSENGQNIIFKAHNDEIYFLTIAHAADLLAAEARNSASEDDLHKKINLLEQALFDAEARHLAEVTALKTDFNTLLSGWRDDLRDGKTREVIASITVILLEGE